MPLYEYKCTACEHVFEEIRSFKDADASECPKCEGCAARNTVTAPGGYYINGDNSASRRPKGAGAFKKGAGGK